MSCVKSGYRWATSGSWSDKYASFSWQSHHASLRIWAVQIRQLPSKITTSAPGRSAGVGNVFTAVFSGEATDIAFLNKVDAQLYVYPGHFYNRKSVQSITRIRNHARNFGRISPIMISGVPLTGLPLIANS